jgi:hypothetical protein
MFVFSARAYNDYNDLLFEAFALHPLVAHEKLEAFCRAESGDDETPFPDAPSAHFAAIRPHPVSGWPTGYYDWEHTWDPCEGWTLWVQAHQLHGA